MITVEVIGRHCQSRLALVGIGIRESQANIIVIGIGLTHNGLGP